MSEPLNLVWLLPDWNLNDSNRSNLSFALDFGYFFIRTYFWCFFPFSDSVALAYGDMNVLIGSSVQLPCDLSWPDSPIGHGSLGLAKVPKVQNEDDDDEEEGENFSERTRKNEETINSPNGKSSKRNSTQVDWNSIQLILWYHGEDISGSPFYSVDARGEGGRSHYFHPHFSSSPHRPSSSSNSTVMDEKGNNDDGQSWLRHFVVSPYSDRAHLDALKTPWLLNIDDVTERDGGWYWCRVDYRWTRTTISRVKLNVMGKFKEKTIENHIP